MFITGIKEREAVHLLDELDTLMKTSFLLTFSFIICTCSYAQRSLEKLVFSGDSSRILQFQFGTNKQIAHNVPVFTILINNREYSSSDLLSGNMLRLSYQSIIQTGDSIRFRVRLTNISNDTLELKNLVPLGRSDDKVFITGKGDHGLSRTHLFRKGTQPVNVIVPDNAWDLGYSSFEIEKGVQVVSLARRDRASIKNGTRTRFETRLYPGGSVDYKVYVEEASGDWHNAMKLVFQDRMLYDVTQFDNNLFQREDLKWIRHTYVHHLMMAWDKYYYDIADRKFHLDEFLKRGKRLYGGDDVVSIWPTWPTLGLDQRNQFDMFRDLPGGTAAMKRLAQMSRKNGARFFICYNPWDESTRNEDHFSGLSNLISETSADGVILDTRGGSSKELQDAADRVRKGVIMYSEGMAIPGDMQGIVSGRVHNALYYPPMLNLNKFIKPEFTIYRVAELYKEPIRREFATAFFNGYGTEMNIMAPGQPDHAEEQYRYLGKTSRILRENTHNFLSRDYQPLISTSADSIWVNRWSHDNKILYTIYSIIPKGYQGYLFEVEPDSAFHFVDLWHHRLLTPVRFNDKWMIQAQTEAFDASFLGTNNEGAVDAIARLPISLKTTRRGDLLDIAVNGEGDELRLWAGMPSYEKEPLQLTPKTQSIRLSERIGRFEGDLVLQLFKKGILLDETVVTIPAGESRRVSTVTKTALARTLPRDMVEIPAGRFTFKATNGDEFISYPKQDVGSQFGMPAYYMDKFPVTNLQYWQFVKSSGYRPRDTANYLKHWKNGRIPAGMESHPVIYVSHEDAKAYAKWAGKRLPTEIEWQYAAQTPALNEWPWKQETPVNRKLQEVTNTLTVTAIEGIDSSMCNLGNGNLYPVGSFPAGANPFGLHDLVGSVWQLTDDVYMSGSYRYIMLKGGSYFKPSSSWWYVQGGPRELHYRQFLLRVSEGFERNATVGFRCLKDKQQPN